MTLSIVIGGLNGIAFAADSRTMMPLPSNQKQWVSFDETKKLFTFDKPNNFVAAVTYGVGGIGNRTIEDFMPDFEKTAAKEGRMSVEEFAKKLSSFFLEEWKKRPAEMRVMGNLFLGFLVGGFNKNDVNPHIYQTIISDNPKVTESPPIGWGGETELAARLLNGYDPNLPRLFAQKWTFNEEQTVCEKKAGNEKQATNEEQTVDGKQVEKWVNTIKDIATPLSLQIPLQIMGLQSYVDLAVFLIRTTIGIQERTLLMRSCGDPIDVACITRQDGLCYVKYKESEICYQK